MIIRLHRLRTRLQGFRMLRRQLRSSCDANPGPTTEQPAVLDNFASALSMPNFQSWAVFLNARKASDISGNIFGASLLKAGIPPLVCLIGVSLVNLT